MISEVDISSNYQFNAKWHAWDVAKVNRTVTIYNVDTARTLLSCLLLSLWGFFIAFSRS